MTQITEETRIRIRIGTAMSAAAAAAVAIAAGVWSLAEAEDRIHDVETALQALANIEQAQQVDDDAMREQVDQLKAQTRGIHESTDLLRQMLLLQEDRVQFLEQRQMEGSR